MSVYLAQSGMQDMFLTESPNISHFRTIYKRDSSFLTRTYEIPFDQKSPIIGDTLIATIPQNGDYINKITIKLVLPQLISTVTSFSWPYVPVIGDFVYGYNQSGNRVFTIQLNSRKPITNLNNWYSSSSGITLIIESNKFVMQTNQIISYLIFSNEETARLFGWVYNSIELFSGFLRFNINSTNPKSQITLQESGWLQKGTIYSYIDDIFYKFINLISLYIGDQCIQEFDGNYIKLRKDIYASYKNRPVLKLLEGDDNPVDFNRVYYFEVPFIQIPVHALDLHSIKVKMITNPLTNIEFYSSIVIDYLIFAQDVKLPKKYKIPVTQIQYFNNNNEINILGPVKYIHSNGNDNDVKFKFNGEFFCNSDNLKIDSFENFPNISRSSNSVVFKNTINMSRIRDQKWKSSNTSIYAETINIMTIEDGLSGLMFNYNQNAVNYQKNYSNVLVPQPSDPATIYYLFDYMPASASNVVSIYSMRRVNILYTGPIVRLRNGVTLEELDFYTDENQTYLKTNEGLSFSTWISTNTAYVSRWYDQSGYGIYISQGFGAPPLSYQNGKYVIYFDNRNKTFTQTVNWLTLVSNVASTQFSAIVNLTQFGTNESSILGTFTERSILSVTPSGSIYTYPVVTSSNVNNVRNGTVSLNTWSVITGYGNSSLQPIKVLGTATLNAQSSFRGYMFEVGLFTGNSLINESTTYYSRRPAGF